MMPEAASRNNPFAARSTLPPTFVSATTRVETICTPRFRGTVGDSISDSSFSVKFLSFTRRIGYASRSFTRKDTSPLAPARRSASAGVFPAFQTSVLSPERRKPAPATVARSKSSPTGFARITTSLKLSLVPFR